METSIVLFFIAVIFFIWNFLFKEYFIDKLRYDLFLIRNKLFSIGISDRNFFKSEIYIEFESVINNSLRYAHSISLFSHLFFRMILYLKYGGRVKIKNPAIEMLAVLIERQKNEDLKKNLKEMFSDFRIALAKYIIFSSLFIFLFFMIQLIVSLLVSLLKSTHFKLREYTQQNGLLQFFSKSFYKTEIIPQPSV